MSKQFIARKGLISKSGSTIESYLNVSGDTTANAHITVGGVSTQFVKGDGTLDSTTYSTGTIGGSITDNQIAFGATTADEIEGESNLTWDGSVFNAIGNTKLDGFVAMGGTAINTNNILQIAGNSTDPTSNVTGANVTRTLAMTADNAKKITGGAFVASTTTTAFNQTQRLIGGDFTAQTSGTGTYSRLFGGSFVAYNQSTGTVTNAYGGQFKIQNLVSGGTITNAYGVYIGGGFNNGTITNKYGLYQSDTDANNYFGGTLTFDSYDNVRDDGTPSSMLSTDASGNLQSAPISTIPLSIFDDDLTYGTGDGTVTNVNDGNGMTFTAISTTGDVTLGTPSTLTSVSTNAVTTNSHTHAITTGIASSNIVQMSALGVDNEYARFTATGLESRSNAEVLSDIGAQASGSYLLDTTDSFIGTLSVDGEVRVDSDVYGVGWNGDSSVATKNDIYDKIETLGGGGDVTKVGTPVNNEIGVWTGDGMLEGDTNLQWNGTSLTIDGTIILQERSDPPSTVSGYGQIWVHNTDTPSLWFSEEDEEDMDLLGGLHHTFTSAGVTAGDLCFINSSGRMERANADSVTTSDTQLGIAMTTRSNGQQCMFKLFGEHITTGLSTGAIYYVHTVDGDWSTIKPSTADHVVRTIGTAISTTKLFFNPSQDYITRIGDV